MLFRIFTIFIYSNLVNIVTDHYFKTHEIDTVHFWGAQSPAGWKRELCIRTGIQGELPSFY